MRQLFITGYGELTENLSVLETDKPIITNNEVLIEVFAASINPIDYKIVHGVLRLINKLSFPAPIGFDVSGRIVQKGTGVSNLEIGDEVFSRVPTNFPGTIAEYIAVDSSVVAIKPTSINFEEAASIPLVGLTAVQGLDLAKIKEADCVLIHAGSGGIGTFAIQYAKSKGARVYTTTSTNNVSWVKDLGADVVIDYKKEKYLSIVKNVDIVLDTLGGNYTKEAFQVIKNGGKVISLIGEIDGETAKEMGLNFIIRFLLSLKILKINALKKQKNALYRFIFVEPNAKQLKGIANLIDAKKIKPIIDKIFSLENAIDALCYLEKGRAKGKVIIKMK